MLLTVAHEFGGGFGDLGVGTGGERKDEKGPRIRVPRSQKTETTLVPVTEDTHHVPHTGKHHSATERREALTFGTMRTDPEDTMLSERSRHRGTQTV